MVSRRSLRVLRRVRAPATDAAMAVVVPVMLVVRASRAHLGGELRGVDSGEQLVERVH
jgi:hypothetical protein